MITTNDQHEVKPFPFMRTPGFKSWRTAGLDVWKPYYLMSFACREDGVWISQGMVLWCEQDLMGFCMQALESPVIRIHQITKLVPPTVGQVEMWSWIPIKEIWQREDDSKDECLYVVGDGGHQLIGSSPAGSTNTRHMKKIFNVSEVPSDPGTLHSASPRNAKNRPKNCRERTTQN